MKYYIIAGEASGDLHASNMMREILHEDPNAEFRFWGGDLMQSVGGTLVKHYRELAFMGFIEVISHLHVILRNISFCKKDIIAYQPDALIFIDYPGFNMRIAKWAKSKGLTTHYYISPQIWAWKENRIKAIKRDFDYMYVILPFEKDFYENKHQFPVHFVGHPLLDAISQREQCNLSNFNKRHQLAIDKPVIAILPGSRQQEIKKMLPRMLSNVSNFEDYQFIIAGAPNVPQTFYSPFIEEYSNVHWVANDTYNLLDISCAALVTSGTATLETALLGVPEIVCYRGNWLSYLIAKKIITLKYISLVNLIMDREVVKELIQGKLNTKNLKVELERILEPNQQDTIRSDYQILQQKLGGQGASKRIAKLIVSNLNHTL